MSKSRRRDKKDDSIFELLSDLSLSVLGLFLIFFVVYSLIFSSQNLGLEANLNLRRQAQDLQGRTNDLSKRVGELEGQLNTANEEKSRLSEDLAKETQRANNAENEKLIAQQRNQYTGSYIGTIESKYYDDYCYSSNYQFVTSKLNILYIQEANIVIYTEASYRGTFVRRYQGSLSGNVFTGSPIDYSRSEGVEKCGSDTNSEVVIEFFSDYLEAYNKGSSNRTTLRKE